MARNIFYRDFTLAKAVALMGLIGMSWRFGRGAQGIDPADRSARRRRRNHARVLRDEDNPVQEPLRDRPVSRLLSAGTA